MAMILKGNCDAVFMAVRGNWALLFEVGIGWGPKLFTNDAISEKKKLLVEG